MEGGCGGGGQADGRIIKKMKEKGGQSVGVGVGRGLGGSETEEKRGEGGSRSGYRRRPTRDERYQIIIGSMTSITTTLELTESALGLNIDGSVPAGRSQMQISLQGDR